MSFFLRVPFLFFAIYIAEAGALPETVKIAGIFDENVDKQTHDAFKFAIQSVNEGDESLALHRTTLVSRILHDFKADLFTGPQQICALAEEGILAIFGPQRRLSTALVASVANATGIPHLMTRWRLTQDHPNTGVNLHPHHAVVSRALIGLIKYFNWTSFALIYDDAESLVRASNLLDGMNGLRADLVKLNSSDINGTLLDVKSTSVSYIVLDCPSKVAQEILRVADSLDMSSSFHYILTTWDVHLLDLEKSVKNLAVITALQLIDVNDPSLLEMAEHWGAGSSDVKGLITGATTEAALIYDSVQLFVRAVRRAEQYMEVVPESVLCETRQKWKHGDFMRHNIIKTEFRGLTGPVSFNASGYRTKIRLHIVEPLLDGLYKVGNWTEDKGVQIDFNYTGHREPLKNSIRDRVLRVLVKLDRPYVMINPNASSTNGSDRYRGFCVDMMANLSRTVNFSYELIESTEPYGSQNPITKEWDGLVRELIDKKADMALGAMTITRDREEVIEFSQPFLYFGVQILLKTPETKTIGLFSFLDPLEWDVWMYILIGYISTASVLFVIGRLSPNEWYNPNPCVEEAGVVENQFSIFNAMWFAFGSLMQIGTDIAPRAISTRFLAGIWWFFTMIMVGSYTANLAAYLTFERMKLPIDNAHDLANQNEIKYGCLEGGATCQFFQRSLYPDYMRMWGAMSADHSNFVKDNVEGIERVKASAGRKGYAYLMESITLDYEASRNCSITGIGNLLDTKGYGVAFPKNSPFRREISVAILTQQDKGYLDEMKLKWWFKEDGGSTCREGPKAMSGTNAMGMDMVAGVFVVVTLGVGLGLTVAVVEFVWKFRKNPEDYKESLPREMWKTLRGTFQHPFARSKPIVRLATAEQLHHDNGSTAVPFTVNQRGFSSYY